MKYFSVFSGVEGFGQGLDDWEAVGFSEIDKYASQVLKYHYPNVKNYGSILWGNDPKTGKPIMRDVGLFQINLWAHGAELQKLGLDVIHSKKDNIRYGKILYARRGTKDWIASIGCWG